jgi:hypothetical protein
MILIHSLLAIAMLAWSVTAADMLVSIGAMACGIVSAACALVGAIESKERGNYRE